MKSISARHGRDQTGEIRRQPQQPNEQAEFAKVAQLFLIPADEQQRGPQRMAEHQDNGQYTGYAVQIEVQPARNLS